MLDAGGGVVRRAGELVAGVGPGKLEWPTTVAQARAIQERLRDQVVRQDRLGEPRLVAGVDVGFEEGGRVTRAAVAVLTMPELELHEHAVSRRETTFPYVPGYLSFREIPAVLDALQGIEAVPDLILCDGHGLAHPRRCGLASHLGLLVDTPTIGVANSSASLTTGFPRPRDGRTDWRRGRGSAVPVRSRWEKESLSTPHRTG